MIWPNGGGVVPDDIWSIDKSVFISGMVKGYPIIRGESRILGTIHGDLAVIRNSEVHGHVYGNARIFNSFINGVVYGDVYVDKATINGRVEGFCVIKEGAVIDGIQQDVRGLKWRVATERPGWFCVGCKTKPYEDWVSYYNHPLYNGSCTREERNAILEAMQWLQSR